MCCADWTGRYSLHGPLARIVLFGRPVFIFNQGSVQNGQDISGVFARMLPPHLFVRPLSGPFGQSRRTHFQGELHFSSRISILFANHFLWVFIIVDALNAASRSRAVKDEPISSILCKSPIQFAIQSSLDSKDKHTNCRVFATVFLIIFSPCRVNVGCGPAEERVLLTGLHAVADIYCESCKTTLGWKYVTTINTFQTFQFIFKGFISQEHAFESSQKYKEGKFIIELAHMIKDNGWES